MYKNLSREERYQIQSLVRAQHSTTEIARIVGRHPSTISRELKRGRGLKGYRAEQACRKAAERASHSRNAKAIAPSLWQRIETYIRCDWSPEQIAGHFPISHETVYLRIYADKAQGGCLHKHLRSQKPRRKRLGAGQDRRGQIPMRVPIAQRPASVNSRKHIGHWEGDTVIGAGHKQAIVTLVERKSGMALLAKVPFKRADLVAQAIEQRLKPYTSVAKTLTLDNGKEFSHHQQIDKALGLQTYFADPYSSWQRGSNENFNGLLRQYVPKKRALSTVTQEELTMIENRLNHRPRKRLGFKTPYEVFHASLKRVAVRT
jgi:IS30 family transposase